MNYLSSKESNFLNFGAAKYYFLANHILIKKMSIGDSI